MLCLVTAQHQQVGDTQKLEIQQYIFRIFAGKAAAQDMRHCCYIVFVLQSGGNSNRSRAAALACALEQPVAQVFVYIFAAVGGDIDIFRVEFA